MRVEASAPRDRRVHAWAANVRDQVDRHEVADCVLGWLVRSRSTSRSERRGDQPLRPRRRLRDQRRRIIRQALPDREASLRDKVLVRNSKWEPSAVPAERRRSRFGQRPALLLLTGDSGGDRRKALARDSRSTSSTSDAWSYFVGIGNLLYGVDADLERNSETRNEHVRRLAEVAHLMLEAGFILVVTAAELTPEQMAIIHTTVPVERIETIWLGASGAPTPLMASLAIGEEEECTDAVLRIKAMLEDKGIIYRA